MEQVAPMGDAFTDLPSLIERVERAEGSDRELDADIAIAMRWKPLGRIDHWVNEWPPGLRRGDLKGHVYLIDHPGPEYANWPTPEFTASLDAALALVEAVLPGLCIENLGYIADSGILQGEWLAQLRPRKPRKRMLGPITAENVRSALDGLDPVSASTPALALLLALLRAVQRERDGEQQQQEQEKG